MEKILLAESHPDFNYSEYVEYCEEMGIEPQGENSKGYWDWVSELSQIYFEEDVEQIGDNITNAYETSVLSGSLGLWYGNREIEPLKFDSLPDAIDKVLKSFDYDCVVRIYLDNGKVTISCAHHDGTNHFEIIPADGTEYKYAV